MRQQQKSGLSTGAKVGIGCAAGFGVLILISVVIRLAAPEYAAKLDADRRQKESERKAHDEKVVEEFRKGVDARKAVFAKVSRDNFNRTSLGMTYEEVCDILGPGKIVTESRDGFGDSVMRATWSNSGVFTTISMTFRNGKLVSKSM
jgi:hypothetical protein